MYVETVDSMVGEDTTSASKCEFRNRVDFVVRKRTSNNMDKLWRYFHASENYPEYYLGVASKVAVCKCPTTGKIEWHNGDSCILASNGAKKGSVVTVEYQIKDKIHNRDFIFMGWVKEPVHEWRMRSGTLLILEQSFVDGLLPVDKRYLRMTL